MRSILLATLAAAVFVALAVPSEASAQMFNEPFSFKYRGGEGERVGLSIAHKQLILERELLGRAADNPLVRDASGALLTVERANGGQAFVSLQESPFAVRTSRSRLGGPDLTFAYGQGGGDSLLAGSSTNRVMATWMWSLSGQDGYRGVSPTTASSSSASIDLWIGQLHSL